MSVIGFGELAQMFCTFAFLALRLGHREPPAVAVFVPRRRRERLVLELDCGGSRIRAQRPRLCKERRCGDDGCDDPEPWSLDRLGGPERRKSDDLGECAAVLKLEDELHNPGL